jgi:hypothetical protein
VSDRLGVLLLGQGVDRAELLAAARNSLQTGIERLALLGGQLPVRRLGRQLEPLGDPPQLDLGVGGLIP